MVFLDAIHYHVRSEGQIVKKAVYIAIGINMSGIWENEQFYYNATPNRRRDVCSDWMFDCVVECVFAERDSE